MAYQKVTTTSYGGRLKNALQGVGAGFIMLIAGTILLFWNEHKFVDVKKMLMRSQAECVELGDIQQVDAEMNGKMIHASGFATTEDILTDNQFEISLNAIKLIRNSEYYQWVEHTKTETKDKVGGGQETITTYTYSKEWVSSPVNSSSFEDPQYKSINNDVLLFVEDLDLQAENVQFGAYSFPKGLIDQMNKTQPFTIELSPEVIQRYENDFHRVYDVTAAETFIHPTGNVLYIGRNPNSPSIGDVRVTYEKVLPGDVSILAKVNGSSFEKYTDKKNGETLLALEDDNVSMEEMYANQHEANKMRLWLLRFLGVILIFFGFKNIFNIITQLLKVLPFLGNIANLGVNLVAGVLAFAWSLIVIAIAWLTARPVLGIILLVAAGALIWFLGKKSKEKKAQLEAEAAAAPVQPVAPAQPAAPAPDIDSQPE